jgi:hypothetical protein
MNCSSNQYNEGREKYYELIDDNELVVNQVNFDR